MPESNVQTYQRSKMIGLQRSGMLPGSYINIQAARAARHQVQV